MSKGGKKNTPAKPAKRLTLSFSFSGMLGLGAAFVVIATLFFVLGLLVGRGYRPETDLPPLAGIMPEANRTDQARALVLKPEELDYRERLAEDAPKGHGGARRPPAKKKPKPVIERAVDQARIEAAKKSPPPSAVRTAPDEARAVPAASGPREGVYDYVYQVAAFKEQAMADELKDKIARQGLGSGLEQVDSGGAVWHRVMVYFQGRPEDTRSMRDKLSRLGIDRVIMRSKNPANP